MSRKIFSRVQTVIPVYAVGRIKLPLPLVSVDSAFNKSLSKLTCRGVQTLSCSESQKRQVLSQPSTTSYSQLSQSLNKQLWCSRKKHIGSLPREQLPASHGNLHCHYSGLSGRCFSETESNRTCFSVEHHRYFRTKSQCVCYGLNKPTSFQHRSFSFTPKAILDASPIAVQPYLRLIRFDKPIGTWLLYWPCTWSIAMAAEAGHLPDLWMLTLFGTGAFLMRGAGCIINDMWDRDIDKKVERTRARPLASGELTPFQGLVFLGGTLSLALLVLLQLNTYSIILGAGSMVLVVLYPLAKRYTYWPQLMLGVTLNWGVLLAWSALRGSLEWPIIPVYAACVLYTMFYDTIYSHQDKYDDMLIGVKSTALKFGDNTKPCLAGFSSLMVSGLTLAGYLCDQTWPYYTGVAITATHLAHQLYTVDLKDADDCAAKFRSNSSLGLVMFIGTVLGTLLKKKESSDKETESDKSC